jgi:hypothetical protein
MAQIVFQGAFEALRKDREGEVKITFTVPLSDEAEARKVPVQKLLNITINESDEHNQARESD